MDSFNYENKETKVMKGGKIIRKVSIKKGKGFKSITKYRKGKKISTVKRPIHKSHIQLIKLRKFIPGLFFDCKSCKTKKRRGGTLENPDIEEGRVTPTEFMQQVPPDPKRFEEYQKKLIEESTKPVKIEETEKVFSGPTPEQQEIIENTKMSDEDTFPTHPYSEELEIFKEGGKTRKGLKSRKHKKHRA
jgi:hypothetical protein